MALLYNCLVNKFLVNNTSVILYLTDSEDYGQVSVASQYFMTLAQYLRLPMVAWNADNSGTIHSITIIHLTTHLNPELDLLLCSRGVNDYSRWNVKWLTERQVAHPISLLFIIRNGWNFVSRHIFWRCLDMQNFSSLSLVLSKLLTI